MPYSVRNPGGIATSGLASYRFARRYSGNLFWFLFLRLLRCFSSAGLSPYGYVFTARWLRINAAGFPHSDIRGSMAICASPRLFAAYHVLLRLLMPRHSPCALFSFTFYFMLLSSLLYLICSRILLKPITFEVIFTVFVVFFTRLIFVFNFHQIH